MKCQPYHPHRLCGGGRSQVRLTTLDGQSIALKTFNEQFAAAQLIQAQLFLGVDRAEAEAFAAQRILEIRHVKRWANFHQLEK
ncbi:MAG: hypothetical protein H6636_14245 [Anaerolineales bacterium]|nr:hypothetical protein [Anaerolineales bacterium]